MDNFDTLTIKDIAGHLNTSERTVHRLIKDQEIPSFKIGTLRRVTYKAFANYLKNRGA